jgi:hypothetical protein
MRSLTEPIDRASSGNVGITISEEHVQLLADLGRQLAKQTAACGRCIKPSKMPGG